MDFRLRPATALSDWNRLHDAQRRSRGNLDVGSGLAADQLDPVGAPFGRMFVATGNGDFTGSFPYRANMDFGDSILNFDLMQGALTVTDDFTPSIQALLLSQDGDQGSGGVVILPPQTTGNYPNLLVQAGKSGTLYLLRDETTSGDTVHSQIRSSSHCHLSWAAAIRSDRRVRISRLAPAYWNGNVYFWQSNDYLKSFALVNGLLSATPTLSSEQNGHSRHFTLDFGQWKYAGHCLGRLLSRHDMNTAGARCQQRRYHSFFIRAPPMPPVMAWVLLTVMRSRQLPMATYMSRPQIN